jgi:hypothetical protein
MPARYLVICAGKRAKTSTHQSSPGQGTLRLDQTLEVLVQFTSLGCLLPLHQPLVPGLGILVLLGKDDDGLNVGGLQSEDFHGQDLENGKEDEESDQDTQVSPQVSTSVIVSSRDV